MAGKAGLPGRHRKTLDAIFARPAPGFRGTIAWDDDPRRSDASCRSSPQELPDIDSDGGSAHAFTLGGQTIVIHRPHEGKKEMSRASVKRARRFLASVGMRP